MTTETVLSPEVQAKIDESVAAKFSELLESQVNSLTRERAVAKRGSTYADFAAGEYGVLFDPRGWLTIVRGNPASALDGLGLALAAPVWLSGARRAGS